MLLPKGNQSQVIGSSSTIVRETQGETFGNGSDIDSSAPSPPQPERG
ncbi:hypothetical protein SLEP1_g55733 [Rubroshorea leprosula]|uniref:Uncharacterized protein n=1 Tax=Rubroshorea leprosula TaxID=152421 RepID=A0AAV5MII1_9ROSI|nr:hypothetical protein SLEP1_g55733 [Rubroshorea leprosula]